MELYLDTANLSEIKTYLAWGVVDGVTTNPTLAAKEHVSYRSRLKAICKIVSGPVSAEVIATDAPTMIKEGISFSKIAKNIYVKLPMTAAGLEACAALSRKKIPVNMTLIFSVSQALLAAKAGATLISPFEGRLDDISEDGGKLISDIADMFRVQNIESKLLAASIRSPRHVAEAAMAGADIATVPATVLLKMTKHPLTDLGLQKFLADWEACEECH